MEYEYNYRCTKCNKLYIEKPNDYICPLCGGYLANIPSKGGIVSTITKSEFLTREEMTFALELLDKIEASRTREEMAKELLKMLIVKASMVYVVESEQKDNT